MRIALHAFDVAPGKMLACIAESITRRGHKVYHFLPQERINLNPELDSVSYWSSRSDVLILGGLDTAHTIKDQVSLAKLFKKMHKPVVVVEDAPGTGSQPKFQTLQFPPN